MKLNYEEIFKNGNLGCVQIDGETELQYFVVVNDKLILEKGGYYFIGSFANDELICSHNYSAKIMYVCTDKFFSFNGIKTFSKNSDDYVWKREDPKKSTRATLTLSEIKEKLGVDELTIIYE